MGKLSVLVITLAAVISCSAQFQVGVGRFDATGPAVEIPFVRKLLEKSDDVIKSLNPFRWATEVYHKLVKESTRVNLQELSSSKMPAAGESFTSALTQEWFRMQFALM